MEFFSSNGELQVAGQRFHLKGASWFGFETETEVVHGIWSLPLTDFLDFLVKQNFNAIRLPFTAELALKLDSAFPTAVNTSTNPNLEGKSAGFIMDVLVHEAAARGLLIMLDMHCLTAKAGITDLWHLPDFPEAKLIQAWTVMVTRYQHAWNVFAIDLKNEPHDSATWGDGNMQTDWRLAAERIGNAMLDINPRLLIFVEGSSGKQVPITTPEAAFWGGSLASARESPVRLKYPGKLVYSPHVYGPGVYMQEYFKVHHFPENMPEIWTKQWGHLLFHPRAGPAVVVGEWGGFFKEGDIERRWAEKFVQYLRQVGATDQFFWCLNPNSGDTGGLMEDDWVTPHAYKLSLVHNLCPAPSRIIVENGWPVDVKHGQCAEPPVVQSLPKTWYRPEQQQPQAAPPPSQQTCSAGDALPQDLAEAPSLGEVQVDVSAFPTISATGKIVKSWADDQRGQQYQIECKVTNNGSSAIPDMQLELLNPGAVQQVWCLTARQEGKLYTLPDWSTQHGGIQPQASLQWGGIVSNPGLSIIYKQQPSVPDHTEL